MKNRRWKMQDGAWRGFGARDSSRFNGRSSFSPRTFPAPTPFLARSGLKSAFLAIGLLISDLCHPVFVPNYSINWHTIDGGGTSTGGVYSVSGTIGQPDGSTTTMDGGNYSLTGGLWSLIVIQTAGAPTLTISPAESGTAQISWAPNAPGFVLEETLHLSPTTWMNSVSGPTDPSPCRLQVTRGSVVCSSLNESQPLQEMMSEISCIAIS